MRSKRKSPQPEALPSIARSGFAEPRSDAELRGVEIDRASLESVTGGRISIRKGPDPKVLIGIKQLGEAIAAVGQQMAAQKEASNQQMMGMMQQMMQRRG